MISLHAKSLSISALQGKVVEHNVSAGVVVSGLSLVIRHLRREHSGSYTCAATNTEGVTTSNPVSLTVRRECLLCPLPWICVYTCG